MCVCAHVDVDVRTCMHVCMERASKRAGGRLCLYFGGWCVCACARIHASARHVHVRRHAHSAVPSRKYFSKRAGRRTSVRVFGRVVHAHVCAARARLCGTQ